MLGFIGNLSFGEIAVVAVIAILVFGERLPQAMSRAYREFLRLRAQLDDLRRQSGIDAEVRNMQRTFREVSAEAKDAFPQVNKVELTPPFGIQEPREDSDPAEKPKRDWRAEAGQAAPEPAQGDADEPTTDGEDAAAGEEPPKPSATD